MTEIHPLPGEPSLPDRLHRLLLAQQAMSGELSLSSVLQTIVRAGCELVDATFGALAVYDADGGLEHFVYHGIAAGTEQRIGRSPKGQGLLGALLCEQDVLCLDDLTADPRFRGFPQGHPEMRSFLGISLRTRGCVLGTLYLADPQARRFHEVDKRMLRALGAAAGTAIDNARRYNEAERSRDWLTASGAITRALLAQADDEVLLEVVSRALDVGQADYAALLLPTVDGKLRVTVAMGIGADSFRGHVFDPNGSPMGRAILAAQSIRTHDMTLWAKLGYLNPHNYGPAMIAPLVDAQGSRGAVLMVRTRERTPFTPAEVELASMFAAQVAVALELNEMRAEAEQVRVLSDRNQIACDLHDNVIQRLFAIGVGLQALLEQPLPASTAARLSRHVAELDETIEQIRTRIFGLQVEPELPARPRFPRLPATSVRAGTGSPSDVLS